MHYYKSSNEIMQYCFVSNDIALIMHYHALLKRSDIVTLLTISGFVLKKKSSETKKKDSIVEINPKLLEMKKKWEFSI